MSATALLIVDIQNDYFSNGLFPLPGAEQASEKARELLKHFRAGNQTIVHIQHESIRPGSTFFLPNTQGVAIHDSVAPLDGEPVLVKHKVNSFLDTGLEDVLQEAGVKKLVVCGMMTNMCVDAVVRAASDLGFEVELIHDACAAANLSFKGVEVPASQVHAAFVAALQFGYAGVVSTQEYLG